MNERGAWKARFFTIWTGQQLSYVGSYAAQFALVFWLTKTTGSATILATATMVALLPNILLGPFVGALVDRWNRRTVMMVADSFIALVSLWLAYLFWSGAMEPWHIYVVMLARALGGTFHGPAMLASTSLMVPERHYTRVSGLNQTIHGLLSLVGPLLGALLISLMPLHGVMLFDVATAAFAVVPLLFIAVPQPAREHVEALKARSFLSNAREGLRFVLGWPGMLALVIAASILKITLMPAFALAPILVLEHFGGGAAELSFFEASAGIGTLIGGLLLSAWGGFKRKIHTSLMGIIVLGIGSIVLGLTPASMFLLALASVFFIGLMLPIVDGPIMAIMQSSVPPEKQGRVFGLLGSLFALTTPIGLAIAGPVSDVVGVSLWFVLGGSACVACGIASFFVRPMMHIEDQTPAEDGTSIPVNDDDAPRDVVPRPDYGTAGD
jgi:DHA3 family macrolide efflux protein-like MFS transporter